MSFSVTKSKRYAIYVNGERYFWGLDKRDADLLSKDLARRGCKNIEIKEQKSRLC